MFAVYPTAGGQYHWAYMVSSPKYRASVSWFTGMLNVIGLWLGIATAAYLCANMVVSIILVNNPGFTNTPATQYGIFVAMTLFAPLSMICVGNRANRMLEYVLMALSCVGALVIAITLLATQTPKASAVSLERKNSKFKLIIEVIRVRGCSQYDRLGFDRHCLAHRPPSVSVRIHRLRHRLPRIRGNPKCQEGRTEGSERYHSLLWYHRLGTSRLYTLLYSRPR
jgi:hypothetical protein